MLFRLHFSYFFFVLFHKTSTRVEEWAKAEKNLPRLKMLKKIKIFGWGVIFFLLVVVARMFNKMLNLHKSFTFFLCFDSGLGCAQNTNFKLKIFLSCMSKFRCDLFKYDQYNMQLSSCTFEAKKKWRQVIICEDVTHTYIYLKEK